jgi:outer membrane lipoprotein SlyB
MKNIQFKIAILLSVFMGFFLSSCEKNDTLNDNVFIGEMAPQVYWEIGSCTVNAGSDVPFFVQYYTSGKIPLTILKFGTA